MRTRGTAPVGVITFAVLALSLLFPLPTPTSGAGIQGTFPGGNGHIAYDQWLLRPDSDWVSMQ